jgi:hypothetical protein
MPGRGRPSFKKRQKEATRLERRQEKAQRRIDGKKENHKEPEIVPAEPLPELQLEIGPDGSLIGL